MSYSNRPDIVLTKELSLLKPNGKLFLGLGQSADTFAPAVDSFVVTADGRMKSYGAWLKENPTLHVVDRTRVHKDIEDVSPTYHHAYEVSRKPGVTPVVPELETGFFEAGGPPRVILVEKGSLLAHNPRVAEERSAETLAARTKEVSGPDATGHFLDLFRGGALSSPLASAVRDNGRGMGPPRARRRGDREGARGRRARRVGALRHRDEPVRRPPRAPRGEAPGPRNARRPRRRQREPRDGQRGTSSPRPRRPRCSATTWTRSRPEAKS